MGLAVCACSQREMHPGFKFLLSTSRKAITRILIRVPFEDFSERQQRVMTSRTYELPMRGQEGGDSLPPQTSQLNTLASFRSDISCLLLALRGSCSSFRSTFLEIWQAAPTKCFECPCPNPTWTLSSCVTVDTSLGLSACSLNWDTNPRPNLGAIGVR